MKNIFHTFLRYFAAEWNTFCIRNFVTRKNILQSFPGISSFIRRFRAMENVSYSPLDISTQSEGYYSFFIKHFEAKWSIFFIPHQTFRYIGSVKNILHSSLDILPSIRRFQIMENIICSSLDITRQSEVYSSFFVKHFETELKIFVILHWTSRL